MVIGSIVNVNKKGIDRTMRILLTTGVAGSLLVSARALASSVGDTAVGPEAKGIVDVVLQHGITGAMLLIVLYAYWQERKAKNDESAARIADSKAYGESMRVMVVQTTTQMERFNDTAEALVNELRTERHASRPEMHRPPPRGGPVR